MTAETTDAGTPPPSTRPLLTTITVPETPHSIAMSHDGARAYVSHFRSGSVSLIDTATETVTAVLDSEPGAYGVAPGAYDRVVHVAHPDSEFVQTIEVASGKATGTGIGAKAYGLAAVFDRLYATAALEDALVVLDEQVKNIGRAENVDFPVAVTASPDGVLLYVSNYFSATVSVIAADKIALDLPGQGAIVVQRIPVAEGPYGLAVSPDGSRLYVAHFPNGNAISVVDTASYTVTDRIDVGGSSVRGLAVSRDGSKLYVANYFSSSVSVLAL